MPSNYETLFAFDQIDYSGQPIGLVIAETYDQAYNASKSVVITYKKIQKPILSIQDAIKANSFFPSRPPFKYGNADEAIANAPNKIDGTLNLGTQFHFYLENQIAIASPTDDGFEIYSSTQYIDLVQEVVAIVLGNSMNASKINVLVKQLGGAYGGKITRANITAAAAALAANATNKRVRVLLDLNMGLEMIGKRVPWRADYTIGFDNYGKLLGQKMMLYADCGNNWNDSLDLYFSKAFIDNTYSCSNLEISFKLAKTNLPANTAVSSYK
jgi:xanthine dehydrogenase molybdopterin-binding subunit B